MDFYSGWYVTYFSARFLLQTENLAKGLKAQKEQKAEVSAGGRLGAAIRADNDRHIDSEQQQQQLLIRLVGSTELESLQWVQLLFVSTF